VKKGRICLTKVCSWNNENIRKAMVFLNGEMKIDQEQAKNNKNKNGSDNENENGTKSVSLLKRFFQNQFKKILVYMYTKRAKSY
jgi:hypothetical protein